MHQGGYASSRPAKGGDRREEFVSYEQTRRPVRYEHGRVSALVRKVPGNACTPEIVTRLEPLPRDAKLLKAGGKLKT